MQHVGGEENGESAALTATRIVVEVPKLGFDYEVTRSTCLALGGASWVLTASFSDREGDAWRWRLTRFRGAGSEVLVRGTAKTEADAFIALRDALRDALDVAVNAPPAADPDAAAVPAPEAP